MVNVVALLFAAASRSYMVSSRLLLGFVGGACSPENNGECGCVAVRGYKPLLHIHLAWLFRGCKLLLHGFFAATLGFVGGACSPENNGECGCVAVRGCKPLLHLHLAWLFRGYKPLLHVHLPWLFRGCEPLLQIHCVPVWVIAYLFH